MLNKGTVRLSNAKALGSGGLMVTGSATLDTVPHLALDTPIELKADLDITGRYLTLNSIISGSGGIIKSSSAPLRLNAANTYQGDTTLYDGTLVLGKGARLAATNRVNMIGAKAKWDISAAGDQRIGALTGVIGSGVDLGKNSLTFGNDKQQTFAGVISRAGFHFVFFIINKIDI